MEIIVTVLFLVGIYCLCHMTEWKSNNRTTPSGHHKDWKQANVDLTLYGKDYYHKKNLRGGYDIPDKKK